MKTDERFWWTTMLRGLVALIAGSAILAIPDMTKTVLLLPIAILFTIACLAAYGVADSLLVLMSSFVSASRVDRIALVLQGIAGITVGILLYAVFLDRVQLHWFFALIVILSFTTGTAELIVARHAISKVVSRWNLAAAVVAFLFGFVYLYILLARATKLEPGQIAWLIYAYLLAFGFAQCLTAARMLYADRKIKIKLAKPCKTLEQKV